MLPACAGIETTQSTCSNRWRHGSRVRGNWNKRLVCKPLCVEMLPVCTGIETFSVTSTGFSTNASRVHGNWNILFPRDARGDQSFPYLRELKSGSGENTRKPRMLPAYAGIETPVPQMQSRKPYVSRMRGNWNRVKYKTFEQFGMFPACVWELKRVGNPARMFPGNTGIETPIMRFKRTCCHASRMRGNWNVRYLHDEIVDFGGFSHVWELKLRQWFIWLYKCFPCMWELKRSTAHVWFCNQMFPAYVGIENGDFMGDCEPRHVSRVCENWKWCRDN